MPWGLGEGLVLNPLHAVGEPADIALAAAWLTHPDNGFATGSVVTVDGGQTAMLPRPWPADAVSIVYSAARTRARSANARRVTADSGARASKSCGTPGRTCSSTSTPACDRRVA